MKIRAGFTILELIIVVVIVAVLASLAIPKFWSVIERSRGTEALLMLTQIRSSMERCYVSTQDFRDCISLAPNLFARINLENPDTLPNSHFKYSYYRQLKNAYIVIAERTTYELGVSDSGGTICCQGLCDTLSHSSIALCVDTSQVSIDGVGFYEGM